MSESSKHVIVIGYAPYLKTFAVLDRVPILPCYLTEFYSAGVIGLQTAINLLQTKYDVTVIGEYMPGDTDVDYTSPWDSPSHPELTPNGIDSLWWRDIVSGFAPLPTSSLPPNVGAGIYFSSFTVNPPVYIEYLRSQVLALGGRVQRLVLPVSGGLLGALSALLQNKEATLAKGVHAFVNATGMGARTLVPDERVFPTRGQTLVVRGVADRARTRVGDWGISYVIPRSGGLGEEGSTILGGCKEARNWNKNVDDAFSKVIMERCKVLAPELLNGKGEFEVLSSQVGFRPSREGGPRVELEEVIVENQKIPVVHSYGHAGAG
ncbi:MAG: hypothetical protein M4579_001354 [Chaenotheca gracillima]|nr:MAG: hypothetical protein M4579_001354 [Chaenotheca gracillima]